MDTDSNLRTNCSHLFHGKCLKEWFLKCRKSAHCPICKNIKTNPMKVYCKKCNSGLKLVTIYE